MIGEARSLRAAAVAGRLDWSFRLTCSGERFDPAVALDYIASYTALQLERMRQAALDADVVVGPEYFRGSEMFTTMLDRRLGLVEPPDGPTARALETIASETGAVLCCAYDMDHSGRVVQTGLIVDPVQGVVAVHPKHPRQVPAPADWPFNTGPRVYDVAVGRVAVAVCSDCTYDPELPLALARHGMEMLLLPGCGFAGDMWLAYLRVRARDMQAAVIYADDGRAALVDGAGAVLCEQVAGEDSLHARVDLRPRRSSPDDTQ